MKKRLNNNQSTKNRETKVMKHFIRIINNARTGPNSPKIKYIKNVEVLFLGKEFVF